MHAEIGRCFVAGGRWRLRAQITTYARMTVLTDFAVLCGEVPPQSNRRADGHPAARTIPRLYGYFARLNVIHILASTLG
jgi:hypothetical protein